MALDLISSTAAILACSRFGTHESMCWKRSGRALTRVAIQRNAYGVFLNGLTITADCCDADRGFNADRGCGAPKRPGDSGRRGCAPGGTPAAKSVSLYRRDSPAATPRRGAARARA